MVPTPDPNSARRPLGSQTLDRGLTVLQTVVDSAEPMSVSQIGVATSLDRAVTYRLLRTLERRGLISQAEAGGYRPAPGLLRLTPRGGHDLLTQARPILTRLARRSGATTVLSIADRDDEVCLLCVLPPSVGPFVTLREGAAGPLGIGASALALLALRPESAGERPEVTAARAEGPGAVVRTCGELRRGATGLAAAWPGQPDWALAAVFFEGSVNEDDARRLLVEATHDLARATPGRASEGHSPASRAPSLPHDRVL